MAVLAGVRSIAEFAVDTIHHPEDYGHALGASLGCAIVGLLLMFPLINESSFMWQPAIVVWAVWGIISLHAIGRARLKAEGKR